MNLQTIRINLVESEVAISGSLLLIFQFQLWIWNQHSQKPGATNSQWIAWLPKKLVDHSESDIFQTIIISHLTSRISPFRVQLWNQRPQKYRGAKFSIICTIFQKVRPLFWVRHFKFRLTPDSNSNTSVFFPALSPKHFVWNICLYPAQFRRYRPRAIKMGDPVYYYNSFSKKIWILYICFCIILLGIYDSIEMQKKLVHFINHSTSLQFSNFFPDLYHSDISHNWQRLSTT